MALPNPDPEAGSAQMLWQWPEGGAAGRWRRSAAAWRARKSKTEQPCSVSVLPVPKMNQQDVMSSDQKELNIVMGVNLLQERFGSTSDSPADVCFGTLRGI